MHFSGGGVRRTRRPPRRLPGCGRARAAPPAGTVGRAANAISPIARTSRPARAARQRTRDGRAPGAERAGTRRVAVPAQPAHERRDRRPAVPLAKHRQEPHQEHLHQARSARPDRSRTARRGTRSRVGARAGATAMPHGEMTPEVDRLLRLATHGDPETALQLVNALLSGGVDPKMLVEELLAPVQRRLGTLWEEGRVEHAVIQQSTTTMEAALELIEATMPPAPEMSPRVIIACPPGEWHTLPARMLSTLLRLDRCRTELFAPSTSIEELAAIAAPSDTPLLLSCTMPIALFSASTTIAALHQQRQAVIVGGIAFGPNDSRAR